MPTVRLESRDIVHESEWWRQVCQECGNKRLMPKGSYVCPKCLDPRPVAIRAYNLIALPNLKAIRLHEDMTLDVLSYASGVSVPTIRKIEGGGVTRPSTAERLAAALMVPLEDLIGGDG